ncbi:MAG TPA: NAD-dependent epimerase/dehydratase family protein [Acidimicrobiales bacterium]|nr:NAD-dependent epimerase/dehydratase family protein [Acidimicrobiales bacterium]
MVMVFDEAPLRTLYIGGTGTISASCVRLSVEAGMEVTVLNRGRNGAKRELPGTVAQLVADVNDPGSVKAVLDGLEFDSVVNFLSHDAEDASRWVASLRGRTRQYVHISSASVYGKPVQRTPTVESTVLHNRFSEYARAKLRAERALQLAFSEEGFPVTIVRPSHTYDDAHPPLPGDWTAVDRIARGAEIPVHGDGTSLWTLTHAEDFAQGLVGLLGNTAATGEVFHITSDDVLTWDQIYTVVGEALGAEAKLVHLASELFPVVAPDWFWSELIVGDLSHTAVFDNAKVRRFVPGFAPKLTFQRGAARLARWRREHADLTRPDPVVDAVLDRLVGACHAARETCASWAPAR